MEAVDQLFRLAFRLLNVEHFFYVISRNVPLDCLCNHPLFLNRRKSTDALL